MSARRCGSLDLRVRIMKRPQVYNRLRLVFIFSIAGTFLVFFSAVPLTVSSAKFPEAFPCESGGWQVLVGAIESVDIEHENIEIRIRSGAKGIPGHLADKDWNNMAWSKTNPFPVREFDLQVRPEANQKAKFKFTSETPVFREQGSSKAIGLDILRAPKIESGDAVLLVLSAGQCWPSSEKETSRWRSEPSIAKIVLLQACIEESCVKAQCKGKSQCKEKVCNCPQAS